MKQLRVLADFTFVENSLIDDYIHNYIAEILGNPMPLPFTRYRLPVTVPAIFLQKYS